MKGVHTHIFVDVACYAEAKPASTVGRIHGGKTEEQTPIFSMYRSSIIGRSSVTVQLYCDPSEQYEIEGSYPQRCCQIYSRSSDDTSRECVAEIKRKVDPTTKVMLGKDVFWLSLQPGFDAAFAMGLILILDQMYEDDDDVGWTLPH